MTENRNGPFLLEVLGVAGSGKSTITSELLKTPQMERAPFISARDPQHLTQMMFAIPKLAPLIILGLLRRPRMTWADFKLMVFVTRWSRVLADVHYADTGLVFDQGPLYALVRLEAKDLGFVSTRAFRDWRRERLLEWVSLLDTIVWLDAPDDVLISRINQRDQFHWVKGEAGEVSLAFVRRYRDLFLETLGEIDGLSGPEVRRFNTSETSVDEIAARLRPALPGRADR